MKFQQYVTRTVVEGYYQEPLDSLDVVFIGASDIYTSFMPGRAYEQHGFTSYLLASESITSEGVKTAVKEIVTKRTSTSSLTTCRSASTSSITSRRTCPSTRDGSTSSP